MVLFLPKQFEQHDFEQTVRVIKEMPLATVVSASTSYLSKEVITEISHIPFTIREVDMETQEMLLIGHMAKANDQVAQLEETGKCTLVFQGKNDSYVSAAWYEQKKVNHKVVSTWDYATVHCSCEVKVIRDNEEWMMGMLSDTTDNYESMRGGGAKEEDLLEKRWKVEEAPTQYLQGLLKGIVGLEIKVIKLQSKFKMSQNKPVKDVKMILRGYAKESGGDKAEYMSSVVRGNHPKGEEL